MCGIVGVLRYGELGNKDNRMSALYLATLLLELTENRGKDATGVAALFDDGNFFGQKMAIRSTDFVGRFGGEDGHYDGLQTVLREYEASSLRTIIGHCRKKSVGGAFDNVNNHPIKTGNIIGLHNGTLKNHDLIFENLKCGRDGTVDSEAIFRLLQYYTKNCKDPFTLEMLEEVTRRLEGSFSILAFNANNPSQVVSARDGRPAEYCLIKPLKMVLVGSEEKILKAAIWNYNKLAWNHALPGFQKLKESDIETKMLPNDTIALFDLTREITPETKIADLYDTKDVPKMVDRIWKVPAKTTTYNNGYQNRRAGFNNANNTAGNSKAAGADDDKEDKKPANTDTTKSTQDAAGTEDSNKGSEKKVVGLAWNPSLDSYATAFGKRQHEGNIVIDTEKKRVMSLSDAVDNIKKDDEDPKPKLEEDSVEIDPKDVEILDDGLDKKIDPVENFITNKSVEINEILPIESPESDKEDVPATTQTAEEKADALAAIKAGVEKGKSQTGAEKRAVQAAVIAARDLNKFETAAEVATLCDTDEDSLEKITTVALANRILKNHFAEIFKAGYLAGCKDNSKDFNVERSAERMAKAEKHIRVLKSVTAVMDCVMHEDNKTSALFKKWAESAALGEINSGTLKEIFNSGDLRSNKALRNMVSTLDNTTTD